MYTNRVRKIADLEEMLNADVYFLIHNRRSDGEIDGTMIDVLRKMIRFTKRRSKAALVIQTPGGDPDESYYIGEFFREYYDKTEAYVVSDCYSGGTMIALATDRIYLSHSGCLGPIDIQRYYAKNDKEDNWYPAPSGLIEALIKARKNNELDDKLEATFKGKMSVLATYFKDKYTYADLIGEKVKRHCTPPDGKNWEDIWKYLSALNFSHGTPLTYRRLKEIGLSVELMDDFIEEAIKAVIRDIEHEFGDLVKKDYFYDFFKNPEMFSPVKGCYEDEDDGHEIGTDGEPGKKETDGKRQYSMSTNSEKLAVIETPIMGFMQTQEIGMILENLATRYLSTISYGWEEEINMSGISPDDQEKLDTIASFYASVSGTSAGINLDDVDSITRDEIFNAVYQQLYAMAIEAITEAGYIIEDIPNSEVCNMVVTYLTRSPDVISFDEKMESLIRSLATAREIDYDEADTATRIELYYETYSSCADAMLMKLGISEEEFGELSDEEQQEMIDDFIDSTDLEFEKWE